MRILLDTHVLIWFSLNDARLDKGAVKRIVDPVNNVTISIASLWEISIKFGLGKLTLDRPFVEFVDSAVRKKGIGVLPVKVSHLVPLEKLPRHHRDPFDRMIIAQSIVEDLQVLTMDRQFESYEIRTV